jgi:hypothetical protein
MRLGGQLQAPAALPRKRRPLLALHDVEYRQKCGRNICSCSAE